MKVSHSNKTVLSVCDISPLKYGSFEEFMVFLTEKLTSRGFEHVIIFRAEPIESVKKDLLNKGAKIEVYRPSRSNIVNMWMFCSFIKRIEPTIVHFHFYPVYSIVNYMTLLCDVEIVYTDHMGCKKAKSNFKKIMRKLYYFINFVVYNFGISKIVCVSKYVQSKYVEEYGIHSSKLCVVYNGININRFHKKENVKCLKQKNSIRDEFIVTCVGLREEKGPHFLMKAAPLILKEVPNVSFIFVGEGKCKDQLQNMADQFNIIDHVKFTGNVWDLSESIYSISSIVVVPSLTEEAFCFVAAEAMASEAQVIAFDSGAIKEVLYDSNCIVNRDYQQLARKIIDCLNNSADTLSAKKHVESQFSLDSNVSNYLCLYESLL